jgi:hypothetical protein
MTSLIAKPPKNDQNIVSKKLPAIDHTQIEKRIWRLRTEQLKYARGSDRQSLKVPIKYPEGRYWFGYNDFSCQERSCKPLVLVRQLESREGITDANVILPSCGSDPPATVSVYDGTTLVGAVTANSSDSWISENSKRSKASIVAKLCITAHARIHSGLSDRRGV